MFQLTFPPQSFLFQILIRYEISNRSLSDDLFYKKILLSNQSIGTQRCRSGEAGDSSSGKGQIARLGQEKSYKGKSRVWARKEIL